METPELFVYLDKRGKNKEETPLVCFSYKEQRKRAQGEERRWSRKAGPEC